MDVIFRDVEAYRALITEEAARERILTHGQTVAPNLFSEWRRGAAQLLFGLAQRVQPKDAARTSYYFGDLIRKVG